MVPGSWYQPGSRYQDLCTKISSSETRTKNPERRRPWIEIRCVFESLAPEDFVYTVLHYFSVQTIFGRNVTLFPIDKDMLSGFGDLGKSGNLDVELWKNKKIKILKIYINVAQNVSKVWISPKNNFPALFGPPQAIFSMDRGKKKTKLQNNVYFPWWDEEYQL